MKHVLITVAMLVIVHLAQAQAPQGIPYQAAARNSSGAVIASTAISVRFTIRDSVTTGVIKYRETHTTTTDANGMFSLTVGQGTPVSGTFAGINWGKNNKYLQVELDPAGGSSYTDMGTQQMMSVPYSMYSKNGLPLGTTGDILFHNGTNWDILPVGINGKVLIIKDGIPEWECLVSAGYITGNSSVTIGSTITLNNSIIGGNWSSSDTAVAIVSPGGAVSGISTGIATISYSVTSSCGVATVTQIVSVNPIIIGALYGGGIVAYILQPGDPGYIEGETHGLIAAMNDQGAGTFGCSGTLVGASATALGTGASNTTAFVTSCFVSGSASRLSEYLVLGGFDDWHLPSFDELNKLFINRLTIGGFNPSNYWSSSENGSGGVRTIRFSDGVSLGTVKTGTGYIRSVRYF